MGEPIKSVYAQTVQVRDHKYPDLGQTMYRFPSGASATVETVWCMPPNSPFDIDERMSVIGTRGTIQVQDTFPNLAIVDEDGLRSPDTTYWPEFDGKRYGALCDELSYFADHALQGRLPSVGHPEDALRAVQVTLAAEESARTESVISIGTDG